MNPAYSLTPRLLLVGICSLLALLVLVFLLGMEVGRLSPPHAATPASLPTRPVQSSPASALPASLPPQPRAQ